MKKFLNAIRVILVIVCYTLYKAANVLVIHQVAVNISLEHKTQGALLCIPDDTYILYIKSFRYQASRKLI